ncbi:CRY1 protein, partial [Polypterus senegalus]
MVVNTVHWFRKGLRLHDNPSLWESLKGADSVRCVYILDPWFAGSSNVGISRWRFLLQCLEDLDANLRKLNSRLFVIRGQPADVFPRLFKEWNISRLSFEYDSEPFGKERDAAIKKLASEAGVEVIVRISHTLYDLDKIIELNGGQPPLTYKRFQTLISRMEPLETPVESITADVMGKCTTPVSDDHDEKFGVPSLEELGFDTEGLPSAVWPGGETEALTRLERHLERKAWVANFERPRMNANSLLASPTGLSPYLRFGCLSCRLFYFKLTDLYKKVKKNSSPPLSLYGQLLWREFFYTAATNNPRFDKMEGNPICVQIPWDKNPEALAKWAEGRTGFPWIDAIMTQLRQEGWIHHLARHAVACFLTRGDLWISWEEGMKALEGEQILMEITSDHKNLLIWGRKCWETFPENLLPLANCVNAVLSRNLSSVPCHAQYLCRNLPDAIRLGSTLPLSEDIEIIWIIGGVEPYKEALMHPWCDLLYITKIMASFDCDTFFPAFDHEVYRKVDKLTLDIRRNIVSYVLNDWDRFKVWTDDGTGDNYSTQGHYKTEMLKLFTYGSA